MTPSQRVLQDVLTPNKKSAPHNYTDISSRLTVDRFSMVAIAIMVAVRCLSGPAPRPALLECE